MAVPTSSLSERVKERARELGFDLVGIARVEPSEHAAFYRRWLAEGRHGSMAYLARPDAVERRLDPRAAWPALRSAVVVGQNYGPGEDDGAEADPSRGVIARYARGRDYHRVIKGKLLRLLRWLEEETARDLPAARAYVDTGPVLERELARRAGLGWFGRNTMLIHPRKGSYFFLGSLLVELELEPDPPFEADRCGSCTACLDACPTGALLGRDKDGAPVMDATRCISYLTIENRGAIPRELRPAIGNRVFGCDICQEVCPWNGPKFVQITRERDYLPRCSSPSPSPLLAPGPKHPESESGSEPESGWSPGTEAPSLIHLMRMDEDAWDRFSRGRAIRRAKRAGFLRNVAVALGNWGSEEAVPVLVEALRDTEPLVRGHAAWALGRIGGAEAVRALRARLDVEGDGWVRGEVEVALVRVSIRFSCG